MAGKLMLAVFVFVVFIGSVQAQTGAVVPPPPPPPPPPAAPPGPGQIVMGFRGPITIAPAVRGVPYSAQQVTEHTQTLANGTHISEKRQMEMIYRDSQGRERTERSILGPRNATFEAPVIIEIQDPVEGYVYTLDTQNHVAHRAKLTVRGRPPVPTGTAVKQSVPRPPNALTSTNNGVTTVREMLGTQTMEGVNVIGVRITKTIETGTEGNDAPITTTLEMWDSPQLRRTVLMRNSDPRNGDTTTRLTNVSLAEPDPTLFQIPGDYQVVDETGPFQIKFMYQAPAKN